MHMKKFVFDIDVLNRNPTEPRDTVDLLSSITFTPAHQMNASELWWWIAILILCPVHVWLLMYYFCCNDINGSACVVVNVYCFCCNDINGNVVLREEWTYNCTTEYTI